MQTVRHVILPSFVYITRRTFASTSALAKTRKAARTKTKSWYERAPRDHNREDRLNQRDVERMIYLEAIKEEESRMVHVRRILERAVLDAKASAALDELPAVTPLANLRFETKARISKGRTVGSDDGERIGGQERRGPVKVAPSVMQYRREREFVEATTAKGWGLRSSPPPATPEAAPVDPMEQLKRYRLVPPWNDPGSERQTRVLDVAFWMRNQGDATFPDIVDFMKRKHGSGILFIYRMYEPDNQEALRTLVERRADGPVSWAMLSKAYFGRAFFVLDTVGRAADIKAYLEARLNRDASRAFVRYLDEPVP